MIALIGLIPVGAAGGLGRSRGVAMSVVTCLCVVFAAFLAFLRRRRALRFGFVVVLLRHRTLSTCLCGVSVQVVGRSRSSSWVYRASLDQPIRVKGFGGRVLRFPSFSHRVLSSVLSF